MSQETERYQLENNGNTYLGRAKPSSSGAYVEANPEGTATTDLTKLKVDNTIYGIPVGYDVHTYQANKTYTSADADYEQLRDDITNKRVICFTIDSSATYFICAYKLYSSYFYVNTQKTSSTAIDIRGLSITLNSDNVVVDNINDTSVFRFIGNTGTNFYNDLLTSVNDRGTNKSFVSSQSRYLTTAPTANNTSGYLQIVVLSSEPATRYNGYLYIITA